jgi:PleD family two-component response regulator
MAEAPHILIVEDQPSTAEMLTSYFESQGYKVDSVGWGEDALAFVEKTLPDLVVLDIRLPDIDGYEVCRRLRTHRRTKYVPIIFLTEKGERGDKLMGLELGAVDYITKPFDVQELRLRVRNVLRRSNMERLSHPITGLPTSPLSDERLRELLSYPNWTVLSVGLRGLKRFSEAYGFVARDDVVRAVALILSHIVKDQAPGAFVGHLNDADIFVVIAPDRVERVQQALKTRLNEAMSFFYPYADRKAKQGETDAELPHLVVTMGVLTSSMRSFGDLESLRQALVEVQKTRLAD